MIALSFAHPKTCCPYAGEPYNANQRPRIAQIGFFFVNRSISETPALFALVGIRLSIYAAYSAASPQNFKGSPITNTMIHTIFTMERCILSALPLLDWSSRSLVFYWDTSLHEKHIQRLVLATTVRTKDVDTVIKTSLKKPTGSDWNSSQQHPLFLLRKSGNSSTGGQQSWSDTDFQVDHEKSWEFWDQRKWLFLSRR